MEQPHRKDGTGSPDRMTARQRPAARVDCGQVKPRALDHGNRLHGIGLHDLGHGQGFAPPDAGDGGHGGEPRPFRRSADRGPGQKREAPALRHAVRDDKAQRRPVRRHRRRGRRYAALDDRRTGQKTG
jgi:hypothetical protein